MAPLHPIPCRSCRGVIHHAPGGNKVRIVDVLRCIPSASCFSATEPRALTKMGPIDHLTENSKPMRTANILPVRVLRVLIATLPLVLTVACSVNRRPNDGAPSLGRPLESGVASWYGPGFQGRRTANGEKYNMYDLTA